MKYFVKSLTTSLLIGIPLAVVLIIFLYMKNSDDMQNFPQEYLTADSIEETFETDRIKEAESMQQAVKKSETTTSPVTLSFAGDVHFSEQYIAAYDKSGISAFADEEMISYMQSADLFVLNHEFVFSNRGEAMADKEYTLRNDPKYVKILQELGTDVVSIANNHILDFGQDAFLDTIDTLKEAEIAYAGGGRNIEEATAPVVRTINGQTFAILAATRVSPSYDWYANSNRPGILQTYDAAALNEAIAEAESKYDHTIVLVHWGIERNETPEEYQRTLAKGYIDAGADLIIGCHPHVLQGFEYYKGVPICYSLGNYLFGNRTGETLLLNATFDKNEKLEIHLIPCERKNGVLSSIPEPAELFNHLTDISFGAAVSHGGTLIE